MPLHDIPLRTITGDRTSLGEHRGKAVLIVNVASKCGLTPQYEGLERLQQQYADQGFTVLGAPCNQFKGQEPGSAAEIQEFCSTTYGVTFPLLEKLDVNGDEQHPLFAELTKAPYDDGRPAGDVSWNFEKWLVSPDGEVVARFDPGVQPEDGRIKSAIQGQLAESRLAG